MSLKAMLWALNDAPTSNPAELVVLISLAERAGDDGTCAWPSQEWISARARCTVRTVQRHLRSLEESGLICRGDQRLVSHVRSDRRPVVWDLNLSASRSATARQNDAPSRGDNMSPRSATARQMEHHGTTNGASRHDTAVVQTALEPSMNQEGVGESSQLTAARGNEKPSPKIPDSWIAKPRRARCADHAGLDDPPKCAGCRDLRLAAEAEAARLAAELREAGVKKRAAVDACPHCDVNGILHRSDAAMVCDHDRDSISAFLGAAPPDTAVSAPSGDSDRPAGASEALAALQRLKKAKSDPSDSDGDQ